MESKGAHFYIEMGIENWLETKNYSKAIELFSKALKMEPHNPDAHLLRGAVYVEIDELDLALNDYNKSLEYNPENVGLFFDKASVLFDLGEYDKAILCYEKFLETEPHDVEALYFNGMAHHFIGENEIAQKCIDKALTLIQKSNEFIQICVLLRERYFFILNNIKKQLNILTWL